MHDHATDGGRQAFDTTATPRSMRLHLDNCHDERTVDGQQVMVGLHARLHVEENAREASRLAEIEAAANLIAERLTAMPPAVVESIVGDPCPDDPDGQHHVGCGCDEPETPAAGFFTAYLTDGNGTLYRAEHVDPRHMPAAGDLFRLTVEAPAPADIVGAMEASIAATSAYLDAHKRSEGAHLSDSSEVAEPRPAGRLATSGAPSDAESPPVVSLMEALEASLAAVKADRRPS